MTESSSSQPRAERAPKGRSPSYPGISLRAAVERAQIVYDRYKKHRAPMEAITKAWGFKSATTGPASVSYAALKKFGLLEEEGSGSERTAKLTELAIEILLNPAPQRALARAALMPPIHQDMWDEYGYELPPEEALKWHLVRRGFTDTGLQEFIKEYRETITFAELDHVQPEQRQGDDGSTPTEASPGPGLLSGWSQEAPRIASTAPQPAPTVFQIPLIGGKAVRVQGDFPLSETAWAQLLAVLEAMKPGLVEPQPEPQR